MLDTYSLKTPRLLLRQWQDADLAPFAALNCDPRVMEFFPRTLSLEETAAMVERIKDHFVEHGFGLYACERRDSGKFIGFVGLSVPKFSAHFTPCVEIGWRLAFDQWGMGFAPEAAGEVLRFAFEQHDLAEIVSMTAVVNRRSQRVMEKIGMQFDKKDDFLHPLVADGSPLKPHVLYRMKKSLWLESKELTVPQY